MNRQKIMTTVLAAVKLSAAYQKTSKKRQEELESLVKAGVDVHFIKDISKNTSVMTVADGRKLNADIMALEIQEAQNCAAINLHKIFTERFGAELMNELSIDIPKHEIDLKGAEEALKTYERIMGTITISQTFNIKDKGNNEEINKEI